MSALSQRLVQKNELPNFEPMQLTLEVSKCASVRMLVVQVHRFLLSLCQHV